MANEFKIKSKIDLDTNESTTKWLKFKSETEKLKTIDIKLNTKNLDATSKQINDMYQKMSKMNQSFVNEQVKLDSFKQKEQIKMENARIKEQMRLESARQKEQIKLDTYRIKEQEKVKKQALKESTKTSGNDEQSLLIAKYKDTYATIGKLQQQLSKGVGEGSFNSISSELGKLKSDLDSLYSKIDSKGKLELFEFKQQNSEIVKLEQSLTKVEDKSEKLKKSFNSIEFKNVDTSKLEHDITSASTRIEQLQVKAREGVDVNIELNDVINELDKLETKMKNLKELDSIKSTFENLEGSIKDALGTEHAEKLRGEIETLEGSVHSLDGAFDRSANSVKNMLSSASSNISRINNEMRSTSRFASDFAGSFSAYTLGNVVGDGIVRTIRGIVDAYREMDDAITNVKKVADVSDINSADKLNGIRSVAIQTAKEVGKSSSDVMNAMADTLQAGIGITI